MKLAVHQRQEIKLSPPPGRDPPLLCHGALQGGAVPAHTGDGAPR